MENLVQIFESFETILRCPVCLKTPADSEYLRLEFYLVDITYAMFVLRKWRTALCVENPNQHKYRSRGFWVTSLKQFSWKWLSWSKLLRTASIDVQIIIGWQFTGAKTVRTAETLWGPVLNACVQPTTVTDSIPKRLPAKRNTRKKLLLKASETCSKLKTKLGSSNAFQSPISECGNLKSKFEQLLLALEKFRKTGEQLSARPEQSVFGSEWQRLCCDFRDLQTKFQSVSSELQQIIERNFHAYQIVDGLLSSNNQDSPVEDNSGHDDNIRPISLPSAAVNDSELDFRDADETHNT